MTLAQIIASTSATIATLGDDIFQTIFGVFPTWFTYAVPLGLLALVVTYLLTRKTGTKHR